MRKRLRKRPMTKSEAADVLELAKATVEWEYPLDIYVALEKAIETLREDEEK